MEKMIAIEQKMKRVGANPDSVMRANPKRNCLDRLSVPRKIQLKTPCFKFRISFFYCLFCIFLIDAFILTKDIIQLVEMQVFAEDYPEIVAV